MMGGVRVWRKYSPFRICLPQPRIIRGLMDLRRFMYLEREGGKRESEEREKGGKRKARERGKESW